MSHHNDTHLKDYFCPYMVLKMICFYSVTIILAVFFQIHWSDLEKKCVYIIDTVCKITECRMLLIVLVHMNDLFSKYLY